MEEGRKVNLQERDIWGGLGVHGRTILEWTFFFFFIGTTAQYGPNDKGDNGGCARNSWQLPYG